MTTVVVKLRQEKRANHKREGESDRVTVRLLLGRGSSESAEGKIWAAVLPQLYLIPHIFTTLKMARINKGKALNLILGETSRNMLLFGMLLTLGLVL